jgi:hypothetical protein
MEFWDSVFNVFNFLFALLGLATIILGAYILIKGPIKYQPPPCRTHCCSSYGRGGYHWWFRNAVQEC